MSAAGAATARDLFGLEVIQGSFPGVPLPSDQFDLVVLAHVLEHLPEPREALREVARVLKPGGVFYCMIPNYESLATRALGADWPGFDLPRHLYCYSPATVSKLMSECGLRVERVDHSAVPNDWVGALRLRLVRTPRLRWLARAAHLSSPIALLGCLPLSFLAATCKRAGKICVTARRDGDDARMEGS
jgi:SAM-dependent methyltransferase